jgi:putative membrane protein
MKAQLLLGMAGALALAACGGEAAQDETADDAAAVTATATPTAAAAGDAAAPDPSTPQGFVSMQASSDMYEIEAGRLAEQNGTSEEVKSFGAMMVMDHTNSSQQLQAAVMESGQGLMVPTAMMPKHQQQLTELRNAGTNFDTVYAQQQVAAHQEALTLLQTQAQSGTAAPLKAFAAKTAPIVEAHLGQARQLP